jgi:hypothetical protein
LPRGERIAHERLDVRQHPVARVWNAGDNGASRELHRNGFEALREFEGLLRPERDERERTPPMTSLRLVMLALVGGTRGEASTGKLRDDIG